MSQLSIQTHDGRASYAPGEDLSGVASWRGVRGGTRLQIRLFWYTSGKGSTSTDIVQTLDVPSADTDGSFPFSFTLPAAPYSFSGQLISLRWALELVAEKNDVARLEFTLAPAGREINLYAYPIEPEREPVDDRAATSSAR